MAIEEEFQQFRKDMAVFMEASEIYRESTKDQLDKITLAVVGDQSETHPGFHVRIDRLENIERSRQRHIKYLWGVLGSVVVAVVNLFIKLTK